MRIIFSLFLAAALGSAAAAHETWLEPSRFYVQAGETVEIDLKNGDDFSGSRHSYNPDEFKRFAFRAGGATQPITGRMGDRPAATLKGLPRGLAAIVYHSEPSILTYKSRAKFERFVRSKGFDGALERHAARGLPPTGFIETYSRYAKTLIMVGKGGGADRSFGLETEIVALVNPYQGAVREIPVRVLYRGAPRVNALVTLFERRGGGAATITRVRTDAKGVARLPVVSGGKYLVDAVVLRETKGATPRTRGAVWETLWASLTFAVP